LGFRGSGQRGTLKKSHHNQRIKTKAMHHNGGLSLGIQITPFAYRGIGWKKQEGLKQKPHKNFQKNIKTVER